MAQPAWGLYRAGGLVATIRARSVEDALYQFRKHALAKRGDRVYKVK